MTEALLKFSNFPFATVFETAVNVTYACPNCDQGVRTHFETDITTLDCPHCQSQIAVPDGAFEGNQVKHCLVCPSVDLFVRKDFPQKIGVGLVVIGIIGSSIAWFYSSVIWTYAILFATALIDVVLYSIVGNSLRCYRCLSEYRSVEELDSYNEFNLEIHEKHRQTSAKLDSIPKQTSTTT